MKKLKEKLNAKLSKNGGFTLVEMLIVVAIIAILIAVSIPLISTTLEDAKDATDDANYRSAAMLGQVTYLTTDNPTGTYWYCISTTNKAGGVLTKQDATPDAAYKSRCTGSNHGETGTSANQYIKVTISASETDIEKAVKVEWAAKAS